MTLEEINIKRKELDLKEKELKKQLHMLKVEKKFIQSVCEHPNLRKWTNSDYGGGTDAHEGCVDCGYTRNF